jgi:hypothetical protein
MIKDIFTVYTYEVHNYPKKIKIYIHTQLIVKNKYYPFSHLVGNETSSSSWKPRINHGTHRVVS